MLSSNRQKLNEAANNNTSGVDGKLDELDIGHTKHLERTFLANVMFKRWKYYTHTQFPLKSCIEPWTTTDIRSNEYQRKEKLKIKIRKGYTNYMFDVHLARPQLLLSLFFHSLALFLRYSQFP